MMKNYIVSSEYRLSHLQTDSLSTIQSTGAIGYSHIQTDSLLNYTVYWEYRLFSQTDSLSLMQSFGFVVCVKYSL